VSDAPSGGAERRAWWVVAALAAGFGCAAPSFTTIDEYPCPSGGTELTYDNFARGFFDEYCERCHAGTAPHRNGAPESVTFDSEADVLAHRERIFVRAAGQNNSMPPGPDDPPREERDLLAEFLACEGQAPSANPP
jgi:hypothetical protein